MRHIVTNATDLPPDTWPGPDGPVNLHTNYVRSQTDPTIMIHPRTGDSYVRADGLPWEYAGWLAHAGEPAVPAPGFPG